MEGTEGRCFRRLVPGKGLTTVAISSLETSSLDTPRQGWVTQMLLLQVRRPAVAEIGLHPMVSTLYTSQPRSANGPPGHRVGAGGQVSSPRHPAAGLGSGVGLHPGTSGHTGITGSGGLRSPPSHSVSQSVVSMP
jgi:hypothetical protein